MNALERLESVRNVQREPALASSNSARGKSNIYPRKPPHPVLAILFRLRFKTKDSINGSLYLSALPQVTSMTDAAELSNHSFRVWYLRCF